jgi:hypothetical protein
MIKETCRDFLEKEVATLLNEIDNKKDGLMVELLGKADELGLLDIAIPEKYEGFGQDINTSMLSTEVMGTYSSFAVAFAAHAEALTELVEKRKSIREALLKHLMMSLGLFVILAFSVAFLFYFRTEQANIVLDFAMKFKYPIAFGFLILTAIQMADSLLLSRTKEQLEE